MIWWAWVLIAVGLLLLGAVLILLALCWLSPSFRGGIHVFLLPPRQRYRVIAYMTMAPTPELKALRFRVLKLPFEQRCELFRLIGNPKTPEDELKLAFLDGALHYSDTNPIGSISEMMEKVHQLMTSRWSVKVDDNEIAEEDIPPSRQQTMDALNEYLATADQKSLDEAVDSWKAILRSTRR